MSKLIVDQVQKTSGTAFTLPASDGINGMNLLQYCRKQL